MNNLIETTNLYYNNALEFVGNNQISQAVELLEKCLKYYSKDVHALNLLGVCHYVLCDFDKAYFYWSKSVMISNENNRAEHYLNVFRSSDVKMVIEKYNVAIDHINCLKYEDAIVLLEEITQLNNDLIEPYIIMGLCYSELKEYRLSKKNIQHALTMDKYNAKYLTYLSEINDKGISKNKVNKFKTNKMAISLISLLFIITSILYYQKHNNYIQTSRQTEEYQKKIQGVSLDLETMKNDYNNLKVELENEKHKDDLINKEIILDNEKTSNNKIYSGSESELFKSAISYFKNKEYDEAADRFEHIVSKGVEESLVSESMYFVAVCFERIDNYKMAGQYYIDYISRFNKSNYYDDSLYNYGIMLYKQGDKDVAKEVLIKLVQEVPDSIFANSKVRYLLGN